MIFLHAQAGSFRADLVCTSSTWSISSFPPCANAATTFPELLEHFMLLAASRYGRNQPRLAPAQLRQLMAPGTGRAMCASTNVADAFGIGR